ncbi:MAG: ParB/RepB/Spo0J family partition protein [Synergistales bacterium]|nr:ParB/RepB/Spo0J family partition protein [Synergistales bacterium]
MAQGKALGRGLGALIPSGDDDGGRQAAGQRRDALPVEKLVPNEQQPRKEAERREIATLAESIVEHGVLQPLVVRRMDGDEGRYEIVAGERRWWAAKEAGLDEVPVTVVSLTEHEALEVALVENLQREDLNPMEIAEGLRQLQERFGMKQDEVARRIGWSRPVVANKLRLLQLPETVQAALRRGGLSEGIARLLLGRAPEEQSALAKWAEEEEATVRQVEDALARKDREAVSESGEARSRSKAVPPAMEEKAQTVGRRLGVSLTVGQRGGKGSIRIAGMEQEVMDRLLDLLEEEGPRLFPGK